jgi:hypothetical protein
VATLAVTTPASDHPTPFTEQPGRKVKQSALDLTGLSHQPRPQPCRMRSHPHAKLGREEGDNIQAITKVKDNCKTDALDRSRIKLCLVHAQFRSGSRNPIACNPSKPCFLQPPLPNPKMSSTTMRAVRTKPNRNKQRKSHTAPPSPDQPQVRLSTKSSNKNNSPPFHLRQNQPPTPTQR